VRGCCWAPAAATAQRPGGCRPNPGRRRASNRVAAGQQPPRGGAATVSRPNGSCLAKRFQGSCDPAIRFLPRQTVPLAKRFLPNPSCLAKRFLACGPTHAATRLPPPSFKVLPSPLGWRENKKKGTSNKGSWKGRDKGPRKGKRLSLIVSRATSDERERAMSEEAELALIKLASPASRRLPQSWRAERAALRCQSG